MLKMILGRSKNRILYKVTSKFFSHTIFQRRYQIVLSITLLIVITFISFSNSLDNGFTNWDDQEYVTENPLIKDLSWENIKVIFTTFYKEDFRHPMVLLSFSLEYHFFQLDPFIYHLTNLILHIFNSFLVFCLIFILSNNVSISFITALLFGVHPFHVESVAWISERKDVLSTFFFLQAIIYYLLYKGKNKGFYYYLSLFVFILSLLSKAMAVTLPIVLLLCDYLACKKFDRRTLLEKVPFFVISGIFGMTTLFIFKSAGQISSSRLLSLFDNLLIACRSVIFYLTKTLVPFNLSALYPYPRVINVLMPEFFFSLILLLILAIVVFYSSRYTRKVVFGSFFFLITILPILQLIPFTAGGAPMADRYMYIPSIGLFYMVGLAFYRVYNWGGTFERVMRISSVLFLSIVILTFSVLTYQRNKIWRNSETLWTKVIKKYPESLTAHVYLGRAFEEKGLLDAAIAETRKALRINPDFASTHYGLGVLYTKKGLIGKAIDEYKEALRINPDFAKAHNNLGAIYRDRGLLDEAIAEYKEVLRIETDFSGVHNNLGVAYMEKGLLNEAIFEFKKALEIDPDHAIVHYNMGSGYAYKGLFNEAIEEYKRGLKINPDDKEAHFSLGVIYSKMSMIDQAMAQYKEALLIDPGYSEAREELEKAKCLAIKCKK